MEAFTNGKVSALARRVYVSTRPNMVDAFQPIRGGYMMFAYESQIRWCRAEGRGAAQGAAQPVHQFDLIGVPS